MLVADLRSSVHRSTERGSAERSPSKPHAEVRVQIRVVHWGQMYLRGNGEGKLAIASIKTLVSSNRVFVSQLGVAFIGGVLMGLTVPPINAWFLAWVALVPLWVLVVRPFPHALFPISHGLIWGIGYHGIALFWITGIHPMTWLGVSWWASLAIAFFCWTFITLWGAALVAAWAVGISFTSKLRFPTRLLIGIAFWCLLEGFWSAGSLWWTSLSFTQSPDNLPILQLGQISGPNTITAAIVAVNGLIAEAWMKNGWVADRAADGQRMSGGWVADRAADGQRMSGGWVADRAADGWRMGSGLNVQSLLGVKVRRLGLCHRQFFNGKYLGLAVGLFATLHLVGFLLYSRPLVQLPENALYVGIVQGNIPNDIKLASAGWRRALESYTTGYRTLADKGVDAVLIPETALPFLWTDDSIHNSSFYQAVLAKGVVAWVGAFGQQGNNITNSLFTVTGDGKIFSRYDKIKLVPLGEFIPFERFLGRLIDRLSPLDAHLIAGDINQVFETTFGKAIAAICYDSAFAEVFRRQAATGGQFILVASNDAHYTTAMKFQHHAQDLMRAIETDRWAVRATNTGYSGIIDPRGRTSWISQANTYDLHAATIDRRQTQTLYVRWGDWLTSLLLGLGWLGWLIDAFGRDKTLLDG